VLSRSVAWRRGGWATKSTAARPFRRLAADAQVAPTWAARSPPGQSSSNRRCWSGPPDGDLIPDCVQVDHVRLLAPSQLCGFCCRAGLNRAGQRGLRACSRNSARTAGGRRRRLAGGCLGGSPSSTGDPGRGGVATRNSTPNAAHCLAEVDVRKYYGSMIGVSAPAPDPASSSRPGGVLNRRESQIAPGDVGARLPASLKPHLFGGGFSSVSPYSPSGGNPCRGTPRAP